MYFVTIVTLKIIANNAVLKSWLLRYDSEELNIVEKFGRALYPALNSDKVD